MGQIFNSLVCFDHLVICIVLCKVVHVHACLFFNNMKVSDVDSIGHVRTRNIDNSKSKSVIYKQVQLTLLINLLLINYDSNFR